MSEVVLTLVVACIGSSGLASLLTAVLNRKWSKQDKEETDNSALEKKVDAVVEAQKVTMIDRVRYLGRGHIQANKISLEDKENLYDMYRAYKALGGNGHLETVMAEIARLPVVEN